MTLLRAGRSLAFVGLVLSSAPAVGIDWVPVADAGNAPDGAANCIAADCGSVPYDYHISRTEVTNAQYAEFLNAKAASDSLALYSVSMGSSASGGITRSGSPGSYTYAVKPGYADKPVTFVGFYDAARFANWLHNGQGGADTESGAYVLLGGTATPSNGLTVARDPGAEIAIPSENEWYKAAYYDGSMAGYYDFPTRTDAPITCAAPTAAEHHANCDLAVGNVTDAGAYTGSEGPYGSVDQGGNVWEWNEQIADALYRGVRGGSWNSDVATLAASAPSFATPSLEESTLGFRVVNLVPEPAGTGLLAAATLAGLAAWRASRRRPRGVV